jgi:hypothetical protein
MTAPRIWEILKGSAAVEPYRLVPQGREPRSAHDGAEELKATARRDRGLHGRGAITGAPGLAPVAGVFSLALDGISCADCGLARGGWLGGFGERM